MARRTIQLRWHGRCSFCRCELAAGATATFDDISREITCDRCMHGLPAAAEPAPPVPRSTTPRPRRRAETATERERIKALISDARAALDAVHQAG